MSNKKTLKIAHRARKRARRAALLAMAGCFRTRVVKDKRKKGEKHPHRIFDQDQEG